MVNITGHRVKFSIKGTIKVEDEKPRDADANAQNILEIIKEEIESKDVKVSETEVEEILPDV